MCAENKEVKRIDGVERSITKKTYYAFGMPCFMQKTVVYSFDLIPATPEVLIKMLNLAAKNGFKISKEIIES